MQEKALTTEAEKSVTVDVPVTTALNQWTQSEEFPSFTVASSASSGSMTA